MWAVSKSTAETSTALVRSSTASARRAASVSAGCAGRRTTSSPASLEPRELAAQRVELAVGADEPRARAQVERREQADDELVGVDAQRDLAVRVAEQRPKAGAHLLGLGERPPPLLVHVARGVVEGLDLALERDVRPRLVGVPGEQQPLGDAEARVVLGQRVHRRLRTAHRSGKAASKSVVRRYAAPDEPPVPALSPMVRSTILTWR